LAILDGANLIFHEAGHVIFAFFGEFLQFLGGSITERGGLDDQAKF